MLWIIIACIIICIGVIGFLVFVVHKQNESEYITSSRLGPLKDNKKYSRIRLSESNNENFVLWTYHAGVEHEISDYRTSANRHRRIHNRIQTFIIIGSSLVTAIITASTSIPRLEWVAAVMSFLVAIATGFIGYFKFRERAVNLQRTADDLEYEFNSVDIGVNAYSAHNDPVQRLRLFVERAEAIKLEQRKREQQLEQSPGRSHSSGGSEDPQGQ